MKVFFNELFEYSHEMNQNLITVMTDHSEIISEKCFKLQSHILNAHGIWNSRIRLSESILGVWQIHPASEWKMIDQNIMKLR